MRDSILKRPVHDWDITTSATPDEMKQVFSDTKIIETGIKHGTLTILSIDGFYECTTYRIDGMYSDGRHPDAVRFTKSLAEDLKRRDFTINAMAYNNKEGLIDLFGGRLDLMDHVIRCVGNPEDRFKEDALRIMRALRFAAQLGFDLEMKTKIATFQMSDTLTKVSAERINSEFCKMLTQTMGSQVINNYREIMNNITINIPKGAAAIIDTLQSNGFEAYLVGGCVRDSILKRPVHDWDITTSATPDEMKQVFSDTKIIETGIKHGTLTILSIDGFYECTTYRIDGMYSDGRHPDAVRFTKSLAEDLKRRDFTINAMAYNNKEGLIDLFGGRLDLMDHVIRCVGNPEDRFKEDALRIMRALRFAAQLGFDLEMKTKIATFQMSDTLTKVSAERINSEFCKMLTQTMGSQVINNYREIIAVFIPEIRDMFGFEQNNPYHMFDVWDHTIEVLVRANLFMDPNGLVLALAAFFHDIGKPHSYQDNPDGIRHFYGHAAKSAEMADSIMRRMRFSNNVREAVVTLVKYHDADIKPEAKYIKRWLNKLGSEHLLRCLIMLKYSDISGQAVKNIERLREVGELFTVLGDVIEQQACFSLKDLAVNGRDLIAAGMKPGKEIGAALDQMLELVLNDECANDKDALLKAVGIE